MTDRNGITGTESFEFQMMPGFVRIRSLRGPIQKYDALPWERKCYKYDTGRKKIISDKSAAQ